MPIYEYQCAKCGQFEVMQKITEATLKRCPTCRGKVSKLMSNTSFQLKGTGWYATDYAGKKATDSGEKTKTSSETKSETKSEGKSEAKVETKSEAKSETKSDGKGDKGTPTTSAAA